MGKTRTEQGPERKRRRRDDCKGVKGLRQGAAGEKENVEKETCRRNGGAGTKKRGNGRWKYNQITREFLKCDSGSHRQKKKEKGGQEEKCWRNETFEEGNDNIPELVGLPLGVKFGGRTEKEGVGRRHKGKRRSHKTYQRD